MFTLTPLVALATNVRYVYPSLQRNYRMQYRLIAIQFCNSSLVVSDATVSYEMQWKHPEISIDFQSWDGVSISGTYSGELVGWLLVSRCY